MALLVFQWKAFHTSLTGQNSNYIFCVLCGRQQLNSLLSFLSLSNERLLELFGVLSTYAYFRYQLKIWVVLIHIFWSFPLYGSLFLNFPLQFSVFLTVPNSIWWLLRTLRLRFPCGNFFFNLNVGKGFLSVKIHLTTQKLNTFLHSKNDHEQCQKTSDKLEEIFAIWQRYKILNIENYCSKIPKSLWINGKLIWTNNTWKIC